MSSSSRPRGHFCYLEIPALDVGLSAAFYAAVFGWEIRSPHGARPKFNDSTGNVSGAWVERPPSKEPGLLPYIAVDSIDRTAVAVVGHGGEIIDGPRLDHEPDGEWMAVFRDPAGNVMGLHQPGNVRR